MAYPVTLIHGPMPGWRDFERDGSAEADGVNSGQPADFGQPYDLARNAAGRLPGAIPGAFEVIRIAAFAMPITYDSAGVAFPAGSMLLVGGLRRPDAAVVVATNGTLSPASGLLAVVTDGKNFFGHWLIIQGIPAATTGTVKIRRTASWGFVGPPTVTLTTIAISGANGSEQWIELPTISRTADAFPSISLFYENSWSGVAPKRELVTPDTQATVYGRVCPDTLPVGYTQVTDPGELNFGSPHWQPNQRWRAYPFSCPGYSPFNRGFTRIIGSATAPPITVPITAGVARRFGQPDTPCDAVEDIVPGLTSANLAYPCIWVGTDLLEHAWQPCCVTSRVQGNTLGLSAFGVAYPLTSVVGGWGAVDVAAGWREISVWAYDGGTSGAITFDGVDIDFGHVVGWGAGAPTVVDGTITFTAAEASGVGINNATVKRLGSAITPPDIQHAVLYSRMTLRFTRPADNGSYVFATAQSFGSRRCDIPPAWPAAGPDGVIPGGYNPAKLGTVANNATVTHAAAAVTSITFGAAGAARNVVGSFLPATDGVWRTRYSPGISTPVTCGEYEQLTARRTSHLGRAGKRFYGAVDNASVASFTLDLISVTQVVTAVPSGAGGLSVTNAHCTDLNWIFLTVAAPAAGTYRITLTSSFNAPTTANGPTVFMGLSITDPFVLVPTVSEALEYYPIIGLSGVITSTPPGAPTDGARYIIGASATGAWVGEDGNVARWDAFQNAWQFIRPDYVHYGCVAATGATRYWRNPGDAGWTTGAGVLTTLDIAIAAAGTIYIRLGKNDPDGVTDSDLVTTDLLTPVVTWAAV